MSTRLARSMQSVLAVAALVAMALAPASPVEADPDPAAPELLLTELVVTPTAAEFLEIHNPTGSAVDLTDVYLTDATYAGGGTYYYNIVTGSNAGGGGFGDFHARFPSGATIGAGEYQTIALAGSEDFAAEYALDPTYELYEDGASADGIPDMLEAFPGSINDQGGLTNGGEVAVLYYWDGNSDLVTDLDYALWGDKAEAVDKTGVSIDGPDPDVTASGYLSDTAIASQDTLAGEAHTFGNSWQREDLNEGAETAAGGNGAGGDDETSEDLSNTWCDSAPTPGVASDCAPSVPVVVINEIMQDPSAVSDSRGEWFELHNPTASAIDIDGWTIKDEGTDEHVIDNGGPLEIPAGGFLVLGRVADAGTNGGVPVDYAWEVEWFLSNGDDEVVLLDGGLSEVDRVAYDGGLTFPDPSGAAMALQDPALDNNVGENWCVATTLYGDGDRGTPGAPNDCTAHVGDWVINEIHADPSSGLEGDANGDGVRDGEQDEFVEILNNTDAPVDISGWTLADGFGSRHTFPGGTVVGAHCVAVVFGGGTPTGGFGGGVVQTASSGALGLNNGGDTVTLNDGSIDQAAVTYGPEGGDDQSLTRDPDITGAFVRHSTATGSAGALFSPGTKVDGTRFTGCQCGEPATFIHDIQGSGADSPEEGTVHTVEGVVVGDFQRTAEDDYLSGFFVQEEPADWDADSATSEGVFVYEGSSSLLEVEVGDTVRLTGEVDEQFGLTRIESLTDVVLCSVGNTVTPTTVTLPVSSTEALEAYEGMLVSLPQELTISEFYNFDRYGEIVLTTDRQYQPTALHDPTSPEAEELAEDNMLNRIQLEDGRTASNPDPAIHPNGMEFDLTNRFRGGDTVQDVTGVLGYSFGAYEIHPTEGADYTAVNTRPAAPDPVGGELEVAAFNVLNYFTTLDTGADICGPTGGQGCRGANNATEFERQQNKIVAAMCAIDADIFGLVELENPNPDNDPDAGDGIADYVLKNLVSALNDPGSACPDKVYGFTDAPAAGEQPIRQGIVYKMGVVTPTARAVLTDTAFTDPNGLGEEKNRPAVAETFVDKGGEIFTLVVNHLKSKGSECGPGDDDPMQGNCNDTRTKGADYLADWLATDPTGSGDPDFLVVGDLNAYAMEDPVAELTEEGFVDLVREYQGGKAYSYVFDGQLGYLDYGMANEDLLPQVTGTTVWHVNADEPDILDYDTSFKKDAQDALYEPNAYRSSDHDPVIIGLELSPYPYTINLPFVADSYDTSTKIFELGVLGPFSGPSAATGEEFRGAATMAFDAIDWRIGDYLIEPVWIDSESDPAAAAENYETAILRDDVRAGILNWHSSVAVSCMDVVADHRVPHFAGFGALETINHKFLGDRERYGYWTTKWWPTPGKLSVSYVEALDHAIDSATWSPVSTTVAIFADDTAWGYDVGDALKDHFEDSGWTVVDETYFAAGETDFVTLISTLKSLAPAVVAGANTSTDSIVAFLNQADAADLDSVIIMDGLGWMGDWYSGAGSSSDYVLDQSLPGWLTPEAQAFAGAFESRFEMVPSPTGAGLAYDAANFFIGVAQAAYDQAGELSSEAIYEFVQDEVWTGKWSYTDGIMMEEYKFTDTTIPDPVVGEGYYMFPVVQYFDGEGKIIFPPNWADQPFTPPGG